MARSPRAYDDAVETPAPAVEQKAPEGPKPCDKEEAINIAKQLRPDQARDRLLEFLRGHA